jgi:hypothetical protein
MPSPDPRILWRLRTAGVAVIGLVLVVGSIAWTLSWPVPEPLRDDRISGGEAARAPDLSLDAAAWGTLVWDTPKPPQAKPQLQVARREVQLVTIMTRAGRTVAGIEPHGGRILFLAAGERAQGIRVVSITDQSVQVEVDGEERTLEVRR